jgi:hypothetical protein
MSNPSNNAQKTVKVTKQLPNKRERASAQFGQLSDLVAGDWAAPAPKSIAEAINRLAAALAAETGSPIP